METLSGQKKLMVVSGLWAAAVAGVVLGVALPLYLRIESFNTRYEAERRRLHELTGHLERLPMIQKEHELASAKLPLLRAALLAKSAAVPFIESIEALSRKTQLYREIRLLSSGTGETAEEAPLIFQITVVGPFARVFEFLVHLENLPYLASVKDLKMRLVKEGSTYTPPSRSGGEKFVAAPGDTAASLVLEVYTRGEN